MVLGDKISMCVFFLGGLFLLWYEVIFVSSHYYTEWSTAYLIHFFFAIFFAVNIYGNWLKVFLTDPTGKGIVFPSGPTPQGWYYCDACVANRPPRSYHCPLCKDCVLKRDHHCWFAGTCAGYANHRYLFALCIHVAIVGIYCNIYNWSFVWSVKGDITVLNLLSFILPHLTAALGNESWYSFYVSTMSMLGFALTFMFVWLVQIQIAQVQCGQTRFERKKGIRDYDQGMLGNLQEVLGHRMLLVLLCPWLPSSLPGDGLKFYRHSQKTI